MDIIFTAVCHHYKWNESEEKSIPWNYQNVMYYTNDKECPFSNDYHSLGGQRYLSIGDLSSNYYKKGSK